jgi:hypothetical protein
LGNFVKVTACSSTSSSVARHLLWISRQLVAFVPSTALAASELITALILL